MRGVSTQLAPAELLEGVLAEPLRVEVAHADHALPGRVALGHSTLSHSRDSLSVTVSLAALLQLHVTSLRAVAAVVT